MSDAIWPIIGTILSTAFIYVVFQDIVHPKVVAWFGVLLWWIRVLTCRIDAWDRYKFKLAMDAKKHLDYDKIRLWEYDTYDGKVFHRRNGNCEMEPFVPNQKIAPNRYIPMNRSQLEYEIERKELLRSVRRYYM